MGIIDFDRLKGRTPVTIKSKEKDEFYIVLTSMLDRLRREVGEGSEAVIDGAIWVKMIGDSRIVMEMELSTKADDGYVGNFRGVKIICIGYTNVKVRCEMLGDEDIKPYEVVTLDYHRKTMDKN